MNKTTFASSLALAGALSCVHHPAVTTRPLSTARAVPQVSGEVRLTGRYEAPSERLSLDALRTRLPGAGRLGADAIASRHAVSFTADVTVDPDELNGMDVIQRGPFALQSAELDVLRRNGFALLPRQARSSFLSGYVDLYLRDQPVYLSADAIFNALHEGFDAMVASLEGDALSPALQRSLTGIRRALQGPDGAALTAEARADVDTYVAVALGLLSGSYAPPVANADGAAIRAFHEAATAAQGTPTLRLFGEDRAVDLSQLRPRGHYAGVAEREQYFRAVMWLGREGLRFIDVVHGAPVLRRREVSAALALRRLSDDETRRNFALIEDAIGGFAGEPEALTFRDLDALSEAVARAGGMGTITDARLIEVIDQLRGDRPRVATTLLVHPDGMATTVPEPVQFSLTPQRYTPDSMVLSRVSFDRVDGGRVPRMMPDPLDAAFAALGNDQALGLLAPSLARYDYATELETAHALVDAHERSYWDRSLYASWMSALRTLSPRETLAEGQRLPTVMTTEAWGRRLLNTQLAAWAEVRHDMVLYAAQSYSAMLGCSYPQAYVDPYPETWSALNRWVSKARELVSHATWRTASERERWVRWTAHADDVTRRLGEIAARERAGEDITSAQLDWVNHAVNAREENAVCTTVIAVDGGWLYDLYEPRQAYGTSHVIVADLHTQPEDERGNSVGRVLHIGTGRPQAMAVVAGPPGRERAYVGFASSYRERVTEGFDRLTDQRWREELDRASSPAWLASVSGPTQ